MSKLGMARYVLIILCKYVVIPAIISCAVSCIPERGTGISANDPQPVRVGVNASLKSAPILLAQEKKWFIENGLLVELDIQPSVAYLMYQLLSEKLDLVTVPEYLIVDYSFKSTDVTIIAVLNRNRSRKIIANTDFIRQPADFAGTSMGVISDSSLGYTLYRFFLHNNIPKDSVTLVYKKPAELADALALGEVQSVLAWPPYTTDAERRIAPKAVSLDAHLALDMYWVLVARNEWLAENEDTALAFLRSLEQAYGLMEKDKETAAIMVSHTLGRDTAEILTEWTDYFFALEMPQSLFLSLEQQASWKKMTTESIQQVPDFSLYVNGSLIRRLDPMRQNVY